MLSVFPSLLSLSQLSPFFIRITLGLVFIYWAYRIFKNTSEQSYKIKTIGTIEALVGISLVAGLWTQFAALVVIIDMIMRLITKIRQKSFLTDGVNYYLILMVMAISLLLTGAGFLAFDLPL